MTLKPNLLATRIQTRLAVLGMSPADAVKRAKLSKDFIYDIFNGKKINPRTNNLNALAEALECDPDYLTGRSDAPQSQDRSNYTQAPLSTFIDIKGVVGAGIWTEGNDAGPSIWSFTRAYFPIDKRFSETAQFDMQVQGTSADLFAINSQLVRAVYKYAWPWPLRGGDIVIIKRVQGDFFERSIRRLREFWNDEGVHKGFALEFETSDPRWKAQASPRVDTYGNPLDDTEEQAEVEGVILYVYGLGSVGEGRDG